MAEYSAEDLNVMDKMLRLSMSEERKQAVLPTIQAWMDRAERLDRKMSVLKYMDLIPENIFVNN